MRSMTFGNTSGSSFSIFILEDEKMIKHEYLLESSDSITLKYKSHGPNIKYERYEKDRSPPIAPEIFLRLGMEKRIKYKYYRGPPG